MNPAKQKPSISNVQTRDSKFRERWLKPQTGHESTSHLRSRNLDYTRGGLSQQPLRTRQRSKSCSVSSVWDLNYTAHEDDRPRRKPESFSVRSSDFTRAPEISEQLSRERRKFSNIRPLDFTNATKQLQPGRRNRQLDYVYVPQASSKLPREKRRFSISDTQLHSSAARTFDYTHSESSEPSPHRSGDSQLHSSAVRTLDYTSKPSLQPSGDSQLHSSAARTLDYTKLFDNDKVRREGSMSKARSLDYMRHGKTSDIVSQPSLSKARSLDYTRRNAIDHAATPPQTRRTSSSAFKFGALDYIHEGGNGEAPWIDNVRNKSAFSNIRLASDDDGNTGSGQN